jgi:endonuclease/exonuclease/phosphatase family metal-dependent hydrolase
LALLNSRIASQRGRYIAYALTGLIAALSVLLPVAVADAKKKKKKDAQVTVMSRNLYLGADLGPAIEAESLCGAIDAGGQILNDVDASNFPERAKLLAAEIADANPDLVGLQEVALWRFQEDADFTGSEATEVRYDFLDSLMAELANEGAKYEVAVSQDEFDQELPADTDGSDATQDSSLPLCGADEDGRLTMRDAILVRKDSKVNVSRPAMGQFENMYEVNLAGAVPIDVERGWVSVEAKVKGSKKAKSAKFRFVNTHLEAFGDPAIREAQARELFANGGPLRTKGQLILLGDVNSGGPKDKVGTGFTTPGDEGAYNALTEDFGLTKYGARQTCCYPDVFQPIIGDYRFDHTVDHVFAKPKVKELDSYVTGDDPSVTITGAKLVASDHGGVVSRLKLKK